ncbi:unnamed protein product [Protopolystoma xenopodis]|uniref:Potassium channel domain-containing protein n=1 Tax=Protopolystoma xenopodis TaxID=117903 RepID=A0A3S5AZ28_9PLAT|nr:unnamed protein product [Protopolystoma xenopodis]
METELADKTPLGAKTSDATVDKHPDRPNQAMFKPSFLRIRIVHLDDIFEENKDQDKWGYFECCYLLLVTISTVGYGDLAPKTNLGRFFICIFIPAAMAISASFLPELFNNFATNKHDVSDKYQALSGQK